MLEKQQIVISYFQQGKSQREIARSMKISRKTVKRYIEQYKIERHQNGLEKGVIQAPQYDVSKRGKVKLTEQVIDFIEDCLSKNKQKRSKGLRKQCMANTDIHEALIKQGYDISYSTVSTYIRKYQHRQREVYIKQTYEPGNCVEFDWGHVRLTIGGKQKSLMLAVFTLAYSNHRWAMLFYRQDMASFLQSHVCYFDTIKGIPKQIVYDNMKTVVARYAIRHCDKKPTNDLLKLSSYYQFDYRFCNARRGNEKGHVEKSVEFVRRKSFCNIDNFETLDHANQHLQNVVLGLNARCVKKKKTTIHEDFLTEQQQFGGLPPTRFDFAVIRKCKIDKYHTVTIDCNNYSIPDTISGPRVNVKILPSHIHIYDHNHKCVAKHQRVHDKFKWLIDIDHYWNSFKIKPGALDNSLAMSQAPTILKELFNNYYKSDPKVFIQLILYSKQNQISLQDLQKATILCSQKCLNAPITVDKIAMIIQNTNSKNKTSNPIKPKPNSMSEAISNNCLSLLKQVQAQIN